MKWGSSMTISKVRKWSAVTVVALIPALAGAAPAPMATPVDLPPLPGSWAERRAQFEARESLRHQIGRAHV